MPTNRTRSFARRKTPEGTDDLAAIYGLDLPIDLKVELLGGGDGLVEAALHRANTPGYVEPTEADLRAAWGGAKPYAEAWYRDNRPGEELPDEPWRNNAIQNTTR